MIWTYLLIGCMASAIILMHEPAFRRIGIWAVFFWPFMVVTWPFAFYSIVVRPYIKGRRA